MKTVLFSDAHLDAAPSGAQRRREFSAFLRVLGTRGFRRVVVLGDLFDFWYEYEHVVFSGYFDVLRAFAELRETGIELHLVCGNHDFWAGRFLRDELGFSVYADSTEMMFGMRRALLLHGDGVNPNDRAYRMYKRVARSRWARWIFSRIHPDRAMRIARAVSHGSRQMAQVQDPAKGAEAAALRAFAQETLAAGRADIVMCGHAHAPLREEFPTPDGPGLYFNTGDWMYHRSRVEWTPGSGFELVAKA